MGNWTFLLEGLEQVRADCPDNVPDVTNEAFFKTLLKLSTEPWLGYVIILKSKNGKPLGFMVMVDTTGMFQPKTLTVYIAYTNAKCPSTMAELRYEAEMWARSHEYEKVQALSYRVKPMPRLSGAVRRYFNRTLGLRERFVVFEKVLS